MNPSFIDDIVRRVSAGMPRGAAEMRHDLEKNLRAMLNASFAKMDLVTREEFEVQSQVLARTRAKLEALERQVAALEREAAEK